MAASVVASVGLMTLPEFADYCGVHVHTVYRWVNEEKLTFKNGLRQFPKGRCRVDRRIWDKSLIPARRRRETGI